MPRNQHHLSPICKNAFFIRWPLYLMVKRTSDNRISKATTLSSCGTNIFLLVIMIQILRSWYMIFRMKSSQIMICQSSNLCWAFRFQLCAVRIGDWVLIQYDSMSFPGLVKAVWEEEVQVSVMVPSGTSCFKWPAVDDTIVYKMKGVLSILDPPLLKSSRGIIQFTDL